MLNPAVEAFAQQAFNIGTAHMPERFAVAAGAADGRAHLRSAGFENHLRLCAGPHLCPLLLIWTQQRGQVFQPIRWSLDGGKPGALQSALCLGILHKRVPDKARAQIFGH
jgi:hypothetical protein